MREEYAYIRFIFVVNGINYLKSTMNGKNHGEGEVEGERARQQKETFNMTKEKSNSLCHQFRSSTYGQLHAKPYTQTQGSHSYTSRAFYLWFIMLTWPI